MSVALRAPLILLGLLCALPVAAHADPGRGGWRHGRHRYPASRDRGPAPDAYVGVKGGGFMLGRGDGAYFGLETGITTSDVLDLGVSIDYFHRRSRDMDLLFETEHGFDPPIRGEITRFESSADFVPVGLTARLRFPTGNRALSPFVSGTLSYEVLHLSFFDRDAPPQPYDDVLGTEQTFMGFGWQAAAGLEISVGSGVGFFGELGLHRGTPSRAVEIDGEPVDLRARMNGGFMRAGLRVAL